MNAHDQLERQLRASVAGAIRRRRHWRPTVRTVLAAGIAVVTVAVVLVAVLALRSPARGLPTRPASPEAQTTAVAGPPGPNVDQRAITAAFNTADAEDATCETVSLPLRRAPVLTGGPPPAQLLTALPALDRLSRKVTGLPAAIRPLASVVQGAIDARYVTRARVVDGTTYWLVPVQGAGHAARSEAAAKRCDRLELSALISELPKVTLADRSATRLYAEGEFATDESELKRSTLHDGIYLFTTGRGRGGSTAGGGLSAAQLRSSGVLDYSGTEHGGVSQIQGVVPGGVARVQFEFRASGAANGQGLTPTVTGDVVNDVFVTSLPMDVRHLRLTAMIWRSASGRVIKTINETSLHA